ncbi:SEL1-like repeat protein [Kaustia mangrovi]|uniref:SEL1-like repeat protein n=1 Tax=Kaustia mangrovi TaxID=2593653 RepID=A0A7S8C518_9HYPH|nr:peptidoglycan-binding protein [Kaustia mangrovi]QPC43535.1 SEL1-like repeat protein [Kaustia mangrovi]
MKPGVPWSIKGIEPEAREAAKAQARRAGLTLGEWLNAVILGDADGEETAQARGHDRSPHLSVDSVIDRIARHERQTADAFGGVNTRISGLNDRLARIAEHRPPPRAEDVPGFRALESALQHVVDHMEANERRTRIALDDLDERLDGLSRRMAGHARDGEADAAHALDALDRRLAGVVHRLEAVEAAGRTAQAPESAETAAATRADLRDIERRIHDLAATADGAHDRAEIDGLREEIASLARQLESAREEMAASRELAAVKATLAHISDRVEAMPDAGPVAEMDERLKALARRLESTLEAHDNRPLDEISNRIHALEGRVSSALAAAQDAGDRSALDGEVARLSERLATMEDRLDTVAELPARFDTLAAELRQSHETARQIAEQTAREALAAQADKPAAEPEALRTVQEDLAAVRDGARASDRRAQETLDAVQATLKTITDRLGVLEAQRAAQPPADGPSSSDDRDLPETVRNLRLPPLGAEDGDDADEEGTPTQPATGEVVAARGAPPPPPAEPETKTDAEGEGPKAGETGLDEGRGTGGDMQSVSRHEDFIAAARRAAQASAHDPRRPRSRFNPFGLLKGRDRADEPLSGGEEATADEAAGPEKAGKAVEQARPGGRGPLIIAGAALLVAAASGYAVLSGRIDLTALAGAAFDRIVDTAPAKADRAERTAAEPARPTPTSDPIATGSIDPETRAQAPAGEPVMSARPAMGSAGKADRGKTGPQTAVDRPVLPAAIGPKGLRDAALNGDPAAQYIVATRFLEGKVVARDEARAARWYERAADQDLAPAQYRLATMYEKGRGVPADLAAAQHWYERAAKRGNAMAMHNLAVLYAGAKPGDPALANAAYWFGRAAALGLKDSQYNLAILYQRGVGVERDPAAAYHWFAIAAARGDKDAATQAKALEEQLAPDELAELNETVEAWEPREQDASANTVIAPVGAWAASAPADSGETDAPLSDRERIREAQALLNGLGFDAGTPDGVMGAGTANAVRLFQLQNGLEVNGTLTAGVLERLRNARG